MASIFNINSPMMRMLSGLWDWIFLNLLTVLFSLPIVTIGAATTAMYYCVGKQRRGEDRLFRDFWFAFKTNFKQATIIWLIFAAIVYILVCSIYASFLLFKAGQTGFMFIGCITILVALLFVMTASWAFPLLARFENTVMETIRNAFICVLSHFFRSLMMAIVNLLPALLMFLIGPQITIYLVAIWFSLAANYNMWLIRKPFKHLEESSEKNYS